MERLPPSVSESAHAVVKKSEGTRTHWSITAVADLAGVRVTSVPGRPKLHLVLGTVLLLFCTSAGSIAVHGAGASQHESAHPAVFTGTGSSLSCQVAGDVGDSYTNVNSVTGQGLNQIAPSWEDPISATVDGSGPNFVLTLVMNGSIPSSPGNKSSPIWWDFGFTQNLSVSGTGWPASPGSHNHLTWWDAAMVWNGTGFSGVFANRLNGTQTTIAFSYTGGTVTLVVPPALFGNPTFLDWIAFPAIFSSHAGSNSLKIPDIIPEFFQTGQLASWPCP